MKRALRWITLIILAVVLVWLSRSCVTHEQNHAEFERRRLDHGTTAGPTYRVSIAGNDANTGTSPGTAWRTLSKVNGTSLPPGSRVLLEGGRTFEGTLRFGIDDVGTPARPITVGSYGQGRATINAGRGDGIVAYNTGGLQITNLNVAGSGRETNDGSGIKFLNDLYGDVKIDFIRVDNVEVHGFGRNGVNVDGARGKSGYRDVRITRVAAHDNGLAGVVVQGEFSLLSKTYAHERVYIGHVAAYDNPGIAGLRRLHSGSGIVLSDVDRGTIEQSVAHDNGWRCDSKRGGPVGIWAWDSNRVVIQHNESYRNRVAGTKDGGGFDFDGGMTNSVMQYNKSHDNDGPGYLMMQFWPARRYANNTLRYNTSRNDARKNNYAAIHVIGAVESTDVYSNSVYIERAATALPAALALDSIKFRSWMPSKRSTDSRIRNNTLQAVGVPPIRIDGKHPGLVLEGNVIRDRLRIDEQIRR